MNNKVTTEDKPERGFLGFRKGELGSTAKAIGGYSLGMGIGAGTGYAVNEHLIKRLAPKMAPGQREAAAFATGFGAALLTESARRRAYKYIDDDIERKAKKELSKTASRLFG